MSAADEINSNKEEDDLPNDNLVTEVLSTANTTSIIGSPESVDTLGGSTKVMADPTTEKNIIDEKESLVDSPGICPNESVKTPSSTDIGKGSGDTATNKEIPQTEVDPGSSDRISVESVMKGLKTFGKDSPGDDNAKQPRESSADLSDEIHEGDLELIWEDDDGNVMTPKVHTPEETTTMDEDVLEVHEEGKDDSNEESKNVSTETENKTDSPETQAQVTDKDPEISSSKLDGTDKDAEALLEEKLMEESLEPCTGNLLTPETDTMEIDEDELLKDDQALEETAMDEDVADKNIEIAPEIEKISEPLKESVDTEIEMEPDEESRSSSEIEKSPNLVASNIENNDNPTESEITQNLDDDTNINNNDDSQENLFVDIDNSINMSMESCPIGIKTDHGLHKPDVMLEIPTQELIDIDDVLDSPDVGKADDDVPDDGKIGDQTHNDKEEATKNYRSPEIVGVAASGTENDGEDLEKESPGGNVDAGLSKAPTIEDPQPSTSSGIIKMTPDAVDNVPDSSDSLGLLAESHRVIDEDDDDDGDDDDDDSDGGDESSSQMAAEHSEDSSSNKDREEREDREDREERDEREEREEIEEREEMEEREDREEREEREGDGNLINQCEEEFEFTADTVGMQEQIENNIMKQEAISAAEAAKTQDLMPLLPDLKTSAAKSDSTTTNIKEDMELLDTIKKEGDSKPKKEGDSKPKKSEAIEVKATGGKQITPVEKQISRRSSISSNDDVIEQIEEIETVKLSDDDDDEPAKDEQPPAQDQIVTTPVDEKTVEDQQTVEDQKTPVKTAEQAKESEDQPTDAKKDSPKTSPAKMKNFTISSVQNTSIVNIVELGESSDEDENRETEKHPKLKELLTSKSPIQPPDGVITINIPTGIEIMSTSGVGGNTSEFFVKEGEVMISGVPKPPPHRPARLNTSEVTIKTASTPEKTLVIPETVGQPEKSAPRLGLEIFSLDSDEEDTPTPAIDSTRSPPDLIPIEQVRKKQKKCINYSCSSGEREYKLADTATTLYYDASKKRKPMVCQPCADAVLVRNQKLIDGVKNMTPLLELDMTSMSQDLVEILDSDSEDEDPSPQPLEIGEPIGVKAAEFLEDNLTELFNKAWVEHKLDDRLKQTQDELNIEMQRLEKESAEIDQMFNDCQRVTDKLRSDLYASFEQNIQELPPLLIFETPTFNYIGPEIENVVPTSVSESRLSVKRKLAAGNVAPAAKRPAIPLGYTPLDDTKTKSQDPKADDELSVVKLSAEAAPADLPPPGELSRPPIRFGMPVYAMKNAFGPWLKGRVVEIMPKSSNPTNFTSCRIKFDHKTKYNGKVLPARCIAYAEPANVRMTIGTRLIALFKDSNKRESYYSGVVAEIPNPVNDYRYLVFFDDGYAQYVSHAYTRLVCECSPLVWEEVHPFSREFVREYLMAYPERPMVRLHEGQHLKTEWDGKWWSSRIAKVDASLAQVVFIGDGRREWIYRGSTRLAPLYLELKAAERHRCRPMPRSKQLRLNMPYVEYIRSDEPGSAPAAAPAPAPVKPPEPQPTPVTPMTVQQRHEEIRRQRAVAKKSTATLPAAIVTSLAPPGAPSPASAPAPPRANLDNVSRVVYYTPKNAVRPYKLVPHKCSPKCKRSDVLSLKELRTYNPLTKPLLSGWERQIVRFKGQKEVMYRAPCGRRLRNMKELHAYLQMTDSEFPVDLFDFYHATHCLAEFVLNKFLVMKKDLSHGKENVPVPCVNYYDDSLPEFCSYNTERTPTSGVPLNLDPEFLCGCDCTDDCEDKTKCACWKMTLEGARTIGLTGPNIGYEYKRLPEPLPSGIYECNSRCHCKDTCLNRVAQHPLQLKLQVFKTLNRGWGIRALNDVPKGSFLCVYAGNLLTDATANLDGLNEGDEYLAELDYIEVVEQMKEGYEEDIPAADKKLDKKEGIKLEESDEEPSSPSDEDETGSKTDKEDDDFRPGYIGLGVTEFNKRLRRRGRVKKEEKVKEETIKEENVKEEKVKEEGQKKDSQNTGLKLENDCITISDDDEVREPSRFAAQPGMTGNDFVSKYKSVRAHFGEDEACYIMDAKVQGNIGRYLNHSCSPNVFVQNVFVDTHDPRFPWVAFFALSHISAGTELTWNYNYDVGSVPGKVLYCYCEAPNCRGRLL